MSAVVGKWELGGRSVSFDCKNKCCEDLGQWDPHVFADGRGMRIMNPSSSPSELIVARVPVPLSPPVPASTHAVFCPTGWRVPAPGSLSPRLFALPHSVQHSCPSQQLYPHLLSGLSVLIMVPFLPWFPVFLSSASLSLHPLPCLPLSPTP